MIASLLRSFPFPLLLAFGAGFAPVIAADHGHLLAQKAATTSVLKEAPLQLVLATPLPKQVKPEIASMVKKLVKAPRV